MDCQNCGTQLPSEAKVCPNCGTVTSTYYANSGASAYDPTLQVLPGSTPQALSASSISTQYGSNPYDVSLQSPYDVNPYTVPPPPPGRPPRKVSPVTLVILIVIVVLIVGGGVGFVLLRNNVSNTSNTAANAPPTATVQNITAQGTFTIVSTSTKSVRQDGQNKIYSYVLQLIDYGDVAGTYTDEETLILHPDNTSSFSGSSTCICTVAGKSGTLMWSFTGTSTANGNFQGQDFDVHGTGDLAKMHGQGVFQGQGSHGTYSTVYHFDS